MTTRLSSPACRFLSLSALFTSALLLAISFCRISTGDPGEERTPVSADNSLGKVVDREGNGALKEVMGERWSVAEENLPLMAGDWVRTGARGANALQLRLHNGVVLILGPDTQVELTGAAAIRVDRGEVEVSAPEAVTVDVQGPGKATLAVQGRRVVRAAGGTLASLEADPKWLTGYKGNASTEALGSLLATVDGRNVPLTMGYHKVIVDIRDQIARTDIEESFVNHTSSVLEGVFYFPLPQDASISGFGMWIGEQYVPGEIVEKERAREIYETILREKRDPGLLEWTGGNIFKARVYPIWGEKRIRITYTQVLPKVGNGYRYSYALQSEMLRQHPLKQLKLQVKVNSVEALTSVESPSHACRVNRTGHSASVEFEEEEYTPTRDFELRIGTQPTDRRVTLIPHRRADDGYFMMLLSAPGTGAAEVRPLLGPSAPLNIVVVADTSGSMLGPQREAQTAFVEALLGSLGEKDRFNLVTGDTETRWAFTDSVENTAANRGSALEFLEKRIPLGWSDLDRTFAEVAKRIPSGAHVVYVGDGLPTSGDADPVAFSQRLPKLYAGNGTFHAVAPGSSYETVVLRAIAALGGGSMRGIGGDADAAQTAFQLLREISTPAVKDLRITFNGVAAAAVYPNPLPNLPAGSQQLVIGRYNPAGGTASGSVTVSGTFEGKPVDYSEDVKLAGAESGNSFIPRLWARHHLDHLLSQGSTPQVKERIIALSEDYQIITPYTSFLVLESDADRERFQVKKTFRMRDGEEFFAEGRDNANFELLRKQMLAAKTYRKRIREQLMARIAEMDRGMMQEIVNPGSQREWARDEYASGLWEGKKSKELESSDIEFGSHFDDKNQELADDEGPSDSAPMEPEADSDIDHLESADVPAPAAAEKAATGRLRDDARSWDRKAKQDMGKRPWQQRQGGYIAGFAATESLKRRNEAAGTYRGRGGVDFIDANFPAVPEPAGQAPDLGWKKEILDLVRTLDRRAVIAASEKGFHFTMQSSGRDLRDRGLEYGTGHHYLSATDWLTIGTHRAGDDFQVQWVSGGERGVLGAAWLLGRVREKKDGDATSWYPPYAGGFNDLFSSHAGAEAAMETLADGRISIVLTWPGQPGGRTVVIIDVAKAAVLEIRSMTGDELAGTTVFSDFVQVAGAWWPTKVSGKDKSGRETSLTRIAVEEMAKADFSAAIARELSRRDSAIVLGKLPEKVEDAKQAIQDGKARLEDHLAVLSWHAGRQTWGEAAPAFEAIAGLQKGKLGLTLLRLSMLQGSRKNEELKGAVTDAAALLSGKSREAEMTAAWSLLHFAAAFNAGNERLALLDTLKPVFERQKDAFQPLLPWEQQRIYALQAMGKPEETFAAQMALAEKYPFQADLQSAAAGMLANRGEIDAAIALLTAAETKSGPWQPHEVEQLRSTGGWILFNAYRLDQYVTWIDAWEPAHPGQVSQQSWDMYLTALIMLDREPRALKLVESWLTDGRREKLAPGDLARLQAAIRHSMGQGYNLYQRRFEERVSRLLAETALYFADHAQVSYLAGQILQYGDFLQTDEGRRVRNELYSRLKTRTATLPPSRIAEYVSWLRPYGFVTDEGEKGWEAIFESVHARWLAEPGATEKQQLAQVIFGYGGAALRIRVHRKVLQDAATPAETAAALQNLFHALLAETWTADVQAELVGLLPRLSSGPGIEKKDDIDRQLRIVAVHLLADWMTQGRANATVAALPGVNEMPRRKVKEASAQALKEAREESVRVLAGLESHAGLAEIRPWIAIERVYQQVKLKVDGKALEAEVRALLASILETTSKKKPEELLAVEEILAARCVATLSWLATRAAGEPGAQGDPALLALLDEAVRGKNELFDAREAKFTLLVLLDRGDALEGVLAEWYGEKREFAKLRWGAALAMIRAERGQVKEAVAVFEELKALGELGPDDLKTLSSWYTVLDSKDKANEAKILAWQARNEWEISNWLYGQANRVRRSGDDVPEELDAEVPVALVALLRKAQWPASHIWIVQSCYGAARDFRVLECLPEAVIGQSSQQIYPFLGQFAPLTDSIQDEATLDRLKKHLEALHARADQDVNRRALRLLEFMVEHRAARQSNGADPHAESALRALREAFKLTWAEGEPLMMAAFLAGQGALTPKALADEQLRELSVLHGNAPAGSEARFGIGQHYASAQWANGRREDALMTLEAAIREFRESCRGTLPDSANQALATWASWLQAAGNYRAAEKVWLNELDARPNAQRSLWLRQALFNVHASALSARAETSLGKGAELYAAASQAIVVEMRRHTNEGHLQQLVGTLSTLWTCAHRELHFPGVGADIRRFAFEDLPPVLAQYNSRNSSGVVSTVAEQLRQVSSPLSALEFLVVRAENEPAWLRFQNADFWAQHGYLAARCRVEAGPLSQGLSDRLLALVLKELREDLRSMSSRGRNMYSIGSSEFWQAKKDDFFRVAHEVLDQHAGSEPRLAYIAAYLYHDLREYADAIEVLLGAHRRNLLGLVSRQTLCVLLHEQKRHAESIPILVPMVAQAPDTLEYRLLLMRAYFQTGNSAKLLETFGQAEEHFRKDGRRTEPAMAALGMACLETELYRQCVTCLDEAVALHVKTAPNRGVGGGTLSAYYRTLSGAWSGLGETDKAVDAAAGAIVSWGRNIDGRQDELSQLTRVLSAAADLDAYVLRLNASVKETGLENPIIRKALGQVYFAKSKFEQATEQLQLAAESQPNDVETHRLLVETLDKMGLRDRATAQLFESARLTGHSVELYVELGKRWTELKQPGSAERAFTNLVEMMPQESESHQALAGVRAEQGLWADASLQWRHVIRIRSREPGGYLGLAGSLLSEGKVDEARAVAEKVVSTDWPAHFGDVRGQAREILQRIEQRGR